MGIGPYFGQRACGTQLGELLSTILDVLKDMGRRTFGGKKMEMNIGFVPNCSKTRAGILPCKQSPTLAPPKPPRTKYRTRQQLAAVLARAQYPSEDPWK